jgi:uncharacterized protein
MTQKRRQHRPSRAPASELPIDLADPDREEGDGSSELELVLVEDGLRVVIRTVFLRTTVEEIQECLERNGIAVGISPYKIRRAVRTARQTHRPVRDVAVAEGTRPRPPSRPRIAYRIPEALAALPPLEPIHDLLSQEWDEIARQAEGLQVWAVQQGDCLAARICSEGVEGLDVRGQPIPIPEPDAPVDPGLEPGPGVELAPNGTDYLACTYGYAGLDHGRISVLEPLWIAPDMMQACFLNLPRHAESCSPSTDDLHALLRNSGITFGIQEQALEGLCRRFSDGSPQQALIPLARGKPAQAARDAVPAFALDCEFRAGSFRADGSIDFKERNIFPAVREEALLAACETSTTARPGQTVFGIEIPGPPERMDLELIAGENVRLKKVGSVQRLFATSDGGVVLKSRETRGPTGAVQSRQYAIAVQPIAHIEGDVGYETGNIDFEGSVVIGGSVGSGFHVRASGGVVIAGSIEAGTSVEAGGDIAVQQGVVGRETRVTAEGSVSARFVQDARIQAGTDIAIGSYVHGAHIQAEGRVVVEGLGGSRSGGGIVGGNTWGLGGIMARNVGSARSSSTHLFAGVGPEELACLDQLETAVRDAEATLQRLLKDIGLVALKAAEVRQLLDRDPTHRKAIIRQVKEAKQISQVHERRVREQQEFRQQISQKSADVAIEVPEQAFSQVIIRIGVQQVALAQDLQQVRFCPDAGGTEVVWEELT